jgi:hypothetical protein
MKKRVISRVWNELQGYLKAINSFPNELEFTTNLAEAYLFPSMRQTKKWIMTRPTWTIYRIQRLDNSKTIRFKKWRKM